MVAERVVMTLVTVAGMAAVTKHPIHLWPLLVIGSETFDSGIALGYKDYHSMVREGDGWGDGANDSYGDGNYANGHGDGWGYGDCGMLDGDGQG
jgi:hypothetical protein